MSRYNIMPVPAEIGMAAKAHIAEISEQVSATSILLGEVMPPPFVYVKLDERFPLGILPLSAGVSVTICTSGRRDLEGIYFFARVVLSVCIPLCYIKV